MNGLAPKKEAKKQVVRGIFGSGVYTFWTGGDPIFTQNVIPLHVKRVLRGVVAQKFREATLWDGEYTPAQLETKKDWARSFYNPLFLQREGQYCRMSGSDNSSNGGAWGRFEVQDIGEISIVNNKLVIPEANDLDGKVLMDYTGNVPHFERGGGISLTYTITVVGHNPGDVVLATIDFINSELRRTNKYLQGKV